MVDARVRGVLSVSAVALAAAVVPAGASAATCSSTVSSVAAATAAVSAAAPGSVVCLADGSYGAVSLNASKAAPGVVLQAANPGMANIGAVQMNGAYLTLAQFNVTGEIELVPGSSHMTVNHNRITGGYMGVNMPTSSTQENDVAITGNKFVGPFGEDAIRANRYHDSDGDGIGLLVQGNEFTNVRENGNHSDCLQAVWVGDHMIYRKNYLHDNQCQGFFIKDQASSVNTVTAEDNLMLRNNAGCGPPATSCGQPSTFQLFGAMSDLTVSRNTIWTPGGGSPTTLRDPGWTGTRSFQNNVISRPWSDIAAPFGSGYTAANNVSQGAPEGTWPSAGFTTVASPAFQNPAADDYRTDDGRGVTWAPADQVYGPGATTSTPPPPPPPDTTAPNTTITSAMGATTSTSASFAFTATESGSTFECKLDAGAYATCTTPKAYSGLSTGAHTFTVRAGDAAGNVDATPATQTWTIAPDQDPGQPPRPADAPPTAELNAPANGATAGSTLLLTPTVADDRGIGHIEFWLDDALLDRDDNPPFRTQIDTDRLSDATHTISLRVFDTSGQAVSTAVRLRVVTYDGTSSVRRGADLSSAPVGEGVTRLQGDTTPGSGVLVSLTPCTSQAGTITDRFALLGDDAGSLDMLYAQGDQCVLELQRLQR
jgi:hypothetical protein